MAGQDKEVDFSNYFKNQSKNNSKAGQSKSKSFASKSSNALLVILILIMFGMIGGLAYMLNQSSKGKTVTIPTGYHLVGNVNQPARLEKIK